MKKFLFLIAGVGIGFAAAHQFSKTAQGASFFSDVDTKAREFSAAVSNAQDAIDKLR